ncbi:MAG: hypothetical protein HUU06_05620 [Planctomycetaceae bacterium]|nr:hypothetical protein [Planctomycetota bacterium]NUN52252.1 hypothetical protein [Planctomycetaceae bacterium]
MAIRLRPHEAPLPTDTSPEAAAVQERLFREMGPAGRMRAALDLSEAVIEEVRRSLERLHPGATRREIDLAFIETCYGADLAREVADHLRDR